MGVSPESANPVRMQHITRVSSSESDGAPSSPNRGGYYDTNGLLLLIVIIFFYCYFIIIVILLFYYYYFFSFLSFSFPSLFSCSLTLLY